ncbi:MAG TPA: FG-GAP-like repeat-containing protein [Bacteroidia bacterium]|jgi:hypothetical protein|nr:FG-GAP-like repeat-containing protein [Bacteroidia bacterium]
MIIFDIQKKLKLEFEIYIQRCSEIMLRKSIKASKFFLVVSLLFFVDQLSAQICFSSPTSFTVGSGPTSITSADFNGDTNQDIATTNQYNDNISILLGAGNGNFGVVTNFPIGANSHPTAIISIDFNTDGFIDLATVNFNTNNISVLLGNGTGSFGSVTSFSVDSGPLSIITSDFNSDGKIDIATSHFKNTVCVLLGNGSGNFGNATSFTVGSGPYSLCSGDFNTDGKTDLVTANINSGDISILLGTGTGNFAPPTTFTVGASPCSIISKDFNVDGKKDLALVNVNSNIASVFLGTGSGNFNNAVTFGTSNHPSSIIYFDFDGDGIGDLVTANNGTGNDISVLLGTGAGNFSSAINFPAGNSPSPIINSDFNSDSKSDIAVVNFTSNKISILLNCSPVGISRLSSNQEIFVYPNPASNQITIQNDLAEKQIVQIFDMNGKNVLNQNINTTTNINISTLSDGVYEVRIKLSNGNISTKKLIVKR